jgi:hypothetical protein
VYGRRNLAWPNYSNPKLGHQSAIRTSQSYLRSLVRTFSTLALDHATQLFNSDLLFLVSMRQLTGCPPQAFSPTSAVIRTLSHSRLSLLSSALCRHCHHYRYPPRSTEPIPIPLVLHHVVPRISLFPRRHLSLPSYPLALILSLFRRRPLHPSHESQHPILAGAQPLERAYCHEPC